MITLKQILEATSVVTAFISGMTLFYAGIGTSKEEESWKGNTARELAVKRRQTVMTWVGIPLAVVAMITQLSAIFVF